MKALLLAYFLVAYVPALVLAFWAPIKLGCYTALGRVLFGKPPLRIGVFPWAQNAKCTGGSVGQGAGGGTPGTHDNTSSASSPCSLTRDTNDLLRSNQGCHDDGSGFLVYCDRVCLHGDGLYCDYDYFGVHFNYD